LTDTVAQASVQQYDYDYDATGNRTSGQIGSALTTSVPNNLNQLTSQSSGGKMHFRGNVSEPSAVTVGGNLATVDAAGNFDGVANVNVGTNTVPVIATDASGNSRTNNYQVTVPSGASKILSYDLDGNLTSDGEKTYEWDAANRLVSINYIEQPFRTEFTYDGLGRRIKIVETDNGTVTSTKNFVWKGNQIAEERDASNTVTRRYFRQGEQRIGGTDAGSYYYTKDHLGSIRELSDTSAIVQVRYDYDPYGQRTKLSGNFDADFGFTGHYYHALSKLYLTLHRAYNPTFGGWLSRDPIAESGGLNLYGYVFDDPISRTDSLGLEADTIEVIKSDGVWDISNLRQHLIKHDILNKVLPFIDDGVAVHITFYNVCPTGYALLKDGLESIPSVGTAWKIGDNTARIDVHTLLIVTDVAKYEVGLKRDWERLYSHTQLRAHCRRKCDGS
jgi:RHS repeat-associated protein